MAALMQEASAAVHLRLQQPFCGPPPMHRLGGLPIRVPGARSGGNSHDFQNETRSRPHILLAGTGLPQTKE